MNLLTDQMFSVLPNEGRLSLAEVFAALARGEVMGFSALRPHQRPAWHMFLVQLAVLALWRSALDEPPTDADRWAGALRLLTPDHEDDAPWTLVVGDERKPAFLQPPVPNQPLKWTAVRTPDALDMLITARNHDLKQQIAAKARAEDWIFALVSLQTMEGYGGGSGRLNGIARMKSGYYSRPMLGLAPACAGDTSIDPSAWWARDVYALLAARGKGADNIVGSPGDHALLWCLDWPENDDLDPAALDPLFIEVCRRVRLEASGCVIAARRSMSKSQRVAAKVHKGNLGDPWAPVSNAGECFALGRNGELDYSRLADLLFSGAWTVPFLAHKDANDKGNMLIVAEAFARGDRKGFQTGGFKSRVVPAPARAIEWFKSFESSSDAARLAQAQIKEIDAVNGALRYAAGLAAADGRGSNAVDAFRNPRSLSDRNRRRAFYRFADPASRRFSRAADRAFFPSLWRRLDAATAGNALRLETKKDFLSGLKQAAARALEDTLPSIPCPSVYRTRAAIRARRAFVWKLRNDDDVRDLFLEESTDGA